MRCLTKQECEQFAQVVGIAPAELSKISSEEAFNSSVRVSLERERHRAYFLATRILSLVGQFEEALLWIVDYGIWPSSENQWLYYRLRAAMGDSANLAARPGHLLDSKERDALTAYLHLGLEFGWGMYLLPRPCTRWVYASHDGWSRLVSRPGDEQLIAEVRDWSVSFDVESGSNASEPRIH